MQLITINLNEVKGLFQTFAKNEKKFKKNPEVIFTPG